MQGLSPMGNRYRYLIVAAYMIMSLIEIVCCSLKVSSCNPCKDFLGSGDPHVSGCLTPRKFLFDSYFGKYDDHIELKIKDLFGEEFLLSESCEEAVHRLRSLFKLTVIERHLIGEGSHRRLLSSLKFDCPSDAISVLEDHFWEAVVIERLPLGVFADPFELSHLVQRGVFQDAAVFGDTNLELPSALSNRSIVEAHVKIGVDNISGQNRGLEVSIELPLHIRYPPLGAGDGYLGIEMGGLHALAPHEPTDWARVSGLDVRVRPGPNPYVAMWVGLACYRAESEGSGFQASTASAVEAVEDLAAASKKPPLLPFRIGHGFDLHRLEPGLPFIIGGIDIPHDRGCDAHSDGDVLLHCVVDAILGALGLPDIGQIFPDTDPRWRGARSSVFMREAVRLMHKAGYELGNLDATLILQKPKLSPHKEAIRANLCEMLGADPSVVNLKAKTHEKVDSLGENRSVAAHTVVLLMRK
ncbi:hypothetical protein QJS10_CPA03g02443 [Acorus calamus]|uniref:2-C-methyl-D-erythritol 2,4-cyclodiphosphate synthase n=1 Tax=Acorus calamus TaxID=4465 RepID=A0AAV9FBS6_ACOCL|nr:hypothetical protein QJS10_CPA03g02443 [Acorus calamus]